MNVAASFEPLGRRRAARTLVLFVLVGLLAYAIVLIREDRARALPADAAFTVGTEVTTKASVERQVKVLKAVYGVTEPTSTKKRATFRRDVAKALAVTEVLDAEARRSGIVVSDKAANDRLNKVISGSAGGRDQFVADLASAGITEKEVLTEIKRAIAGSQLFDRVTKKIKAPTAKQIGDYYEDHRADMKTPERRSIANIVVTDKAAADKVMARLKDGAPFASVAKASSLDSSTNYKGGSLGEVAREQLEADYAQAAFSASSGAVFGPVQTSAGWNVGQVEGITPAKPQKLAQVQEQLGQEMLGSWQMEAWRTWLAKKIRAADVAYADAYRPAHPNTLPSDFGIS